MLDVDYNKKQLFRTKKLIFKSSYLFSVLFCFEGGNQMGLFEYVLGFVAAVVVAILIKKFFFKTKKHSRQQGLHFVLHSYPPIFSFLTLINQLHVRPQLEMYQIRLKKVLLFLRLNIVLSHSKNVSSSTTTLAYSVSHYQTPPTALAYQLVNIYPSGQFANLKSNLKSKPNKVDSIQSQD